MNGAVIARAAVGDLGDLLGAGGQARVYHAPDVSVSDMPGPLVFKQYRPNHQPPHGLHAVVTRRLNMDDPTRARIDRLTAWPLRVVEEGDTVLGVLMRLIPGDYFEDRILPSGQPASTLREIQHLFVDPDRALRFGMPAPSTMERLVICRDFASAIHLLHRNDLVIGDLNAKNAVFRLSGRPAVMLVDCDAIRIRGSVAVVQQLNAPDWDPPEDSLNQATDLYKFGLFVLRCLAPGVQASVSREPSRLHKILDKEGRDLLESALGAAPSRRPIAQTWGRYFDRILGGPDRGPKPAAQDAGTSQTGGWRRDSATGKWVPA